MLHRPADMMRVTAGRQEERERRSAIGPAKVNINKGLPVWSGRIKVMSFLDRSLNGE